MVVTKQLSPIAGKPIHWYNKEKRNPMRKPVLMFSLFLCFGVCGLNGEIASATDKYTFEEWYQKWIAEVNRYSDFISDDGTSIASYREIHSFGVRAIPFLMEKMKMDYRMVCAIPVLSRRIMLESEKKSYRVAVPNVEGGIVDMCAFYRQWWEGGERLAKVEFEERFSKWVNGRKTESAEVQKKLQRDLEYLGVAILPYLLEKIKVGEKDLIPMVSRITSGALEPEASIEECLSWWKRDMEEWTIPFPDSPKK